MKYLLLLLLSFMIKFENIFCLHYPLYIYPSSQIIDMVEIIKSKWDVLPVDNRWCKLSEIVCILGHASTPYYEEEVMYIQCRIRVNSWAFLQHELFIVRSDVGTLALWILDFCLFLFLLFVVLHVLSGSFKYQSPAWCKEIVFWWNKWWSVLLLKKNLRCMLLWLWIIYDKRFFRMKYISSSWYVWLWK